MTAKTRTYTPITGLKVIERNLPHGIQRTVKSRCPWRDDVADKLGKDKASRHR
jgi:hypothetical protein